ncbi:MAG: glycosyltransferase family 4 protein [Rhodospirillales bacterium]|nr:glycosyltransferase family 4 protein [Rhodospirillales bacterium]
MRSAAGREGPGGLGQASRCPSLFCWRGCNMSDAGALLAKLSFALHQMTWLAIYAIAAFGAGQRLLAPLAMADLDAGLRTSLRLTAGIGVFVVSLFLLAATGVLVSNAVLLLVLSGLVAAADCFVTASVSEGHPITVIEALGAGCPVVAFRAPASARREAQ